MTTPRAGHLLEDVCGYIIRPERANYELSDLGPPIFRMSDNEVIQYKRTDLVLENMRSLKIQCSWFNVNKRMPAPGPCVIYLHGNCGSRYDSLELMHLLSDGFSLFTYDACGSGKSDGEYVSLGFYERQDLATVVEYLQSTKLVTAIGLWGRSMGAVTSIMYAAKDKSIKAVIGDSPFSSLRRLVSDLVEMHGSWLPEMVTEAVVKKVRKQIAKTAGFDIDDLDAMKYAELCEVPSFLFHGEDDDFVRPHHSVTVSDHYLGSCIHRVVKGGHNSFRGTDVHSVALPFLQLYLIEKPLAELQRSKTMSVPNSGLERGRTSVVESSVESLSKSKKEDREEIPFKHT